MTMHPPSVHGARCLSKHDYRKSPLFHKSPRRSNCSKQMTILSLNEVVRSPPIPFTGKADIWKYDSTPKEHPISLHAENLLTRSICHRQIPLWKQSQILNESIPGLNSVDCHRSTYLSI